MKTKKGAFPKETRRRGFSVEEKLKLKAGSELNLPLTV